MEDLAFPLLASMFWTSISCISLRLLCRSPYNFLCATWIALSFSGVILVHAIFSFAGWPTNFYMSAVLVPSGFLFYKFNLEKFVDESQAEPLWGRYVFGVLLAGASLVLAFSKIFFMEMLKLSKPASNFEQVSYLYMFMILTMGIAGFLVLLKGKSDFNL